MARIVRTSTARRDIITIAQYIARDKPSAAERWIRQIDQTLQLIAKNPLIGERVDHLAPGVRRFCQGRYLLFYVQIDDGIELRRVLHGARRIEDLL